MKQKTVFLCGDCGYESPEMVRQMSVLRRMEHHERIQGGSRFSAGTRHEYISARRIAADSAQGY